MTKQFLILALLLSIVGCSKEASIDGAWKIQAIDLSKDRSDSPSGLAALLLLNVLSIGSTFEFQGMEYSLRDTKGQTVSSGTWIIKNHLLEMTSGDGGETSVFEMEIVGDGLKLRSTYGHVVHLRRSDTVQE